MNISSHRLDWVTDSLAVGQAPMSYESLEQIRQQGIGAILNLCAEFCDLHELEAEAGFEVYYFPIPDEKAPDWLELEKALDWLDECLYLGKKVMIHCRFGIGRTGTVLNAYLLRKGLGHKLAGKKLKGLKSQPANFDQWWFIRKYGKKEKPLTIREPSLENKNLVDLFPFFSDYGNLVRQVDRHLDPRGSDGRCGAGHARCCREYVVISFIETVYIHHIMQTTLGRVERRQAIQQAVEASRAARQLQRQAGPGGHGDGLAAAYRQAEIVCPLNELGDCLIFLNRPMPCRLFDLPPGKREELATDLTDDLDRLSRQVYFAFTSRFSPQAPLHFPLNEVISGKFVQTFFNQLL